MLGIILLTIGIIAQKPLPVNIEVHEHTIECQACFETYTYEDAEINPVWVKIDDRSAIQEEVDCWEDYILYKLALGQTVQWLDVAKTEKSDCYESDSGKHLWKETEVKLLGTNNRTFNRNEAWCQGMVKVQGWDSWAEYLLLKGLTIDIHK